MTDRKVILLRSVSSQFLALCPISHARCGSSEQRRRGSMTNETATVSDSWCEWALLSRTAVKVVFEWVAGNTVRFFRVNVLSGELGLPCLEDTLTAFTFGVSVITLGAVLSHTNSWVYDDQAEKMALFVGSFPFSPGFRVPQCVRANHKFRIMCDNTRGVALNLLDTHQKLEHADKVIPSHHKSEVFLNEWNEDEAVLAKTEGTCLELTVINLPEVWWTNIIKPVFSAHFMLPKWGLIETVLVLQTEVFERTFIVKNRLTPRETLILQYTESSGAQAIRAGDYISPIFTSDAPVLAQMSCRLYSVTVPHRTLEIWDCNNPTIPLRIVDQSVCCGTVYGFAGFLFHVRKTHITVTEWSTGCKLLMLLLVGCEHRVTSHFSLLL
ncbi:hypothetical protein Pelo_16035 [Pelomyxa schiedti]|nr:hypothetical protein Pelo_16035 [Pelomyxa schiedti]